MTDTAPAPVPPEILAAIRQVIGEPMPIPVALESSAEMVSAPADPLWVSALRGRVLAAIASVVSLGAAGTVFYRAIETLAAGPSLEGAAAVATHAATVTDALSAALIAGSSLVAMLAALGSKAREWLRGAGL